MKALSGECFPVNEGARSELVSREWTSSTRESKVVEDRSAGTPLDPWPG